MDTTTIVKRSLRPGAPGTQRLALLHGKQLVCVRYRETSDGTLRMTTVEIVVDVRMASGCPVQLAVDWREKSVQAKLEAHGARWNEALNCWVTTLRIAKRLKLQSRILGPHRGAAQRRLRAYAPDPERQHHCL